MLTRPQATVPAGTGSDEAHWTADHITRVPPIRLREPFLELLGQTDQPVPYRYEEAVKLTGHSCGAVAGAWIMTRKALEALYPNEIPVRGQIRVIMPGAADEWNVGVFGEVIAYITGVAPETGFSGGEFGQAYNRRNLMVYADEPTGKPPPMMLWVFERIDTGARATVRYNLGMIQPPATRERGQMGARVARGEATPEEVAEWQTYWNDRVTFLFENADTLPGLFTVEISP